MSSPHDPRHEASRALRRLALAGGSAIALFAGTVGVWAVTTSLSGAVVAPGQFVVDGNVKKIQHPTGGIVGALEVREGDLVQQGAVVLRLDDTIPRANLQMISNQLDELSARRARLKAERDGRAAMGPVPELEPRGTAPDIAALIAAEERLFSARREAREGQKAQLIKRIGQLGDEIAGLKAQQEASARQSVLIAEELEGVRGLYEKNLVSISRKAVLERDAAELDGQKGRLIAAVAEAEGKIAETNLQIIQIDAGLREDVMQELQEVESKIAELTERRVTAEDQLKRIEIRAPVTGYVHQLALHTVGGVLTPAEPAMLIVPAQDTLQVEARVNPTDIDQIAPGQMAHVKVRAFNQRTTPELKAKVERIAPDTSRDQQTGAVYYTIRLAVPKEELARLAPHGVAAGMQADVFVKTVDRTPLEYIAKPLHDQIAKAFRER
ncbi:MULTISPECIES: HlyD family type I secretion periplasmic adaptor subunit [unclassified Xanthobacter]|uniref:HlyD family type I secretion periplasmic adaptor subunit n=1 Tax=unclassified Xanthobacter TaxID=2623496 RepID=UPI001F33C82D|nr:MULTISPECIES: HlyD family type I secretion periplasmic adaptor subunit [unclassified Xanthobacter]